MNKNDCKDCIEYERCRNSYASWIFFIIGLISTVAIRVVTVLIHMKPVYGKLAWYIGVGGFFFFFLYKFKVDQNRVKLIKQKALAEKIVHKKVLSEEDYTLIGAILCSLSSNKERINYFFIFGLSAVALILALYMDFFK